MSEHYTRETIEVSAWCSRCNRHTPHRVDAPKLGPCLNCLTRLEAENEAKRRALEAAQHSQPRLWD